MCALILLYFIELIYILVTQRINNLLSTIEMDYRKRCRVCGDEALCFNFNGLSCEACKVFFRRNLTANQKFQCKNANNCLIEKSTRKFCKRCRMDKCFAIGMKKELITIFNNESNLQEDINNSVHQTLLQPYDLVHISEIEKAMHHLPNEHNLPIVEHTQNVALLANLTEHYARRTIKACKSIQTFRELKSRDRLQLVKAFFPEISAIQMSFCYIADKDALRLISQTENGTICFSLNRPKDMVTTKGGYASTFRRFAFALRAVMDSDVTIRNLIFALLLFKPRDSSISCPEFITYNYYVYCHLLQKYLNFKFKSAGEQKFQSLMAVLGRLNKMSKMCKDFYEQKFEPNELPEIVRDLYNL